jgi:hypothetical protein
MEFKKVASGAAGPKGQGRLPVRLHRNLMSVAVDVKLTSLICSDHERNFIALRRRKKLRPVC